MDADLIRALRTLTDPSRLPVLGSLASARVMSVGELVTATGMTRRELMRHLHRLVDTGLAAERSREGATVYVLRRERLAELARALAGFDEGSRPAPGGSKVLRAFVLDGRLESIPVQEKKRLIVLGHLAETVFEPGQDYLEKEVNQRLGLLHPDVASLRRYLVDHGFMEREAGVYRLRPRTDWPATYDPTPDEPA
ncbi:MAG: DUF2087 domain-containing protein [Chloroflexi bacterium]|nr:DUF2087 domain-containing protein [Chloroflexota bacterium]